MLKTIAIFLLLFFIGIQVQAQYTKDSIKLTNNSLLYRPFKLNSTSPPVLPSNLAAQHLPFFCDKEYKLEKYTKVPFRFRLGSVAYCDKMEGKGN